MAMRAGIRRTCFVAAAAWIAGAATGLGYAPPPTIPSSPPIFSMAVSAEPLGELRFTLDPRMGFFAAGDPVGGADPDGRLAKGFLAGYNNSDTGTAIERPFFQVGMVLGGMTYGATGGGEMLPTFFPS